MSVRQNGLSFGLQSGPTGSGRAHVANLLALSPLPVITEETITSSICPMSARVDAPEAGQAYADRAKNMAQMRVALAGYRLAAKLPTWMTKTKP